MKLLYDASILSYGACQNDSRSGIYFTALNILRELIIRKDIEIVLYCENRYYRNLLKTLAFEFPNIKFDIRTSSKYTIKDELYDEIQVLKTFAKNNNEKFFKFILQIVLTIIYISIKLQSNKCNYDFDEYDIFLSPWLSPPKNICKNKNLKVFLILYDLIPVVLKEYKKSMSSNSWFRKILKNLNAKDYYFTISEYSKKDFLKHFPVLKSEHIFTTLLAANTQVFYPCPLKVNDIRKKYKVPKSCKYIFTLSNLDPRKNLVRAIKTFVDFIKKNNINDLVFLVGGSKYDSVVTQLKLVCPDYEKYKNRIIKLGYVPNEDLAPLYSGAEWFTYTSQYEGFGLPPLEAMSCGCPVITSNNSSLPEVVGDAGIMIDWDSDEQHIEAYEKYYFNKELRAEFAQKGLERSKQFSWEKCVDDMVTIFKN